MIRTVVCVALFCLALAMTAQAQEPRLAIDVHALGPQVGEQIPAFELPDQTGRVWTRASIMGQSGALILFHRSADW